MPNRSTSAQPHLADAATATCWFCGARRRAYEFIGAGDCCTGRAEIRALVCPACGYVIPRRNARARVQETG